MSVQTGLDTKDAEIFRCEGSDLVVQDEAPRTVIQSGAINKDKQLIIYETSNLHQSMATLKQASNLTMQQRQQQHANRQAQIAGRLNRIRFEISGLQSQLNSNQTQ